VRVAGTAKPDAGFGVGLFGVELGQTEQMMLTWPCAAAPKEAAAMAIFFMETSQ